MPRDHMISRALGEWRTWSGLAGVALALNAAWELLQLPLYAGDPGLVVCLLAALDDALITTAVVGIATLVRGRWPAAFWPLVVGTLAATAAVIELRAIDAERWAYSDAMPMLAGVGLSPLVQLPLLGALATFASGLSRRRRPRRAGHRPTTDPV